MLKDVALVLRGSIVAQVIGFLALPLLSRLLAPEAFGDLQLFNAVLTLMLVFGTMRYEVAILRARDGRGLAAVVRLCLVLTLVATLIFGVVMAVFWEGWLPWLPTPPFPVWLLLASFMVASVGAILGLLVTRLRAFRTSGYAKIVQSSVNITAAISLAAAYGGGATLIIADAVGKLANVLFLLGWAQRHTVGLWRRVSQRDLRRMASRYREYPQVNVAGNWFNVLGAVLSPFMMYTVFSSELAGYFGLVDRTLALPLALITASVAQVYTGRFAADLRDTGKSLQADFDALVRNMALLGAGPLVVGLLTAPALFEFVFGPEWRTAGEYAQILGPTFFLILISSPTNMVLTVLGHQALQMAWEMGRLAGQVAMWSAVLYFDLSPHTAVLGHSIVLGSSSLAYLLVARHMVIRSDAKRNAARGAEADL
jgi:O-antigen/teichoic acid export membrane protein